MEFEATETVCSFHHRAITLMDVTPPASHVAALVLGGLIIRRGCKDWQNSLSDIGMADGCRLSVLLDQPSLAHCANIRGAIDCSELLGCSPDGIDDLLFDDRSERLYVTFNHKISYMKTDSLAGFQCLHEDEQGIMHFDSPCLCGDLLILHTYSVSTPAQNFITAVQIDTGVARKLLDVTLQSPCVAVAPGGTKISDIFFTDKDEDVEGIYRLVEISGAVAKQFVRALPRSRETYELLVLDVSRLQFAVMQKVGENFNLLYFCDGEAEPEVLFSKPEEVEIQLDGRGSLYLTHSVCTEDYDEHGGYLTAVPDFAMKAQQATRTIQDQLFEGFGLGLINCFTVGASGAVAYYALGRYTAGGLRFVDWRIFRATLR